LVSTRPTASRTGSLASVDDRSTALLELLEELTESAMESVIVGGCADSSTQNTAHGG
jgi:hypothetical protein